MLLSLSMDLTAVSLMNYVKVVLNFTKSKCVHREPLSGRRWDELKCYPEPYRKAPVFQWLTLQSKVPLNSC